jgi:hypothetical protein
MDGIAFELLGRAFGVATPDPAVSSQVARLFPTIARPLAPGGANEVWALARDGDGWSVQPPGLPLQSFSVWADALEAIEFLITTRLLALHHHRPQLHAAGCVVNHHAVLAIGASGAGKSSIALQWSTAGLPLLGDDVILLDETDQAVAFPRYPAVDCARLAEAGATPYTADRLAVEGNEVRYDPRSGGGWAAAAPIGVIGVIRRAPGPLTIESLPPAQALGMLGAALHTTGCGPHECFSQLTRVVREARAVLVTFAHAGEAARALAAFA